MTPERPPPDPNYRYGPPPEPLPPPSPWGPRAKLGGAVLLAAALLYAWLGPASLSVERVGPRPVAGRQVVLLLHGYGAPGDDLVGLAQELAPALPETTFLVPAALNRVGFGGRSWIPAYSAPTRELYVQRLTGEVDATLALLWKVIDGARRKGVACSDIWVGGFSQGGRMAQELALRAPADCTLGGAIIMSGGGMAELPLPPPTPGQGTMRVLVTHGSQDGVVGFGQGQATASYFAASGAEVRFLAFDGAHQIPAAVRQAIPPFLRGEPVGEPVPRAQ